MIITFTVHSRITIYPATLAKMQMRTICNVIYVSKVFVVLPPDLIADTV